MPGSILTPNSSHLQYGCGRCDPQPSRHQPGSDARAKGCKVIDGLAMLVSQGVIGVKHWTGVDPDPSVMRAALEEVFG